MDSRKVIESNDGPCSVPSDCLSELCVRPTFLEKGEMIIEISVSGRQSILFVGSPAALWQSVEIGDYSPRIFKRALLGFPKTFFTLLMYSAMNITINVSL